MCNADRFVEMVAAQCFNPLYIGSMCNENSAVDIRKTGFNPLYIGSMCNLATPRDSVKFVVSIPFISGQCVIFQYCTNSNTS